MLISLLHATWFRSGGISELHRMWLDRAVRPEMIEIVVGLDSHDETGLEESEGLSRAIGPPDSNFSTAVRNWNAAANLSQGDLLFVISDDLEPGQGWDKALVALAQKLPSKKPWALNIGDTGKKSSLLLRHPVVNRVFFSQYGLWNPLFSGVYCDHDLTYRAFFEATIFSAEGVKFDHRSPTVHSNIRPSQSQARANRESEYDRGKKTLESLWGENILNEVPRNLSVSKLRVANSFKVWMNRKASAGKPTSSHGRGREITEAPGDAVNSG